MKYGVIAHTTTTNLGDDVQTYAAMKLLPRVDYFLTRERLDSFRSENNEPVAVVMNAWWMWEKWNWPPAMAKILFGFLFAISITTSKQSILGHIFDHNFIKATNRFSLALYLCHSACRRVIRYLEPDWGYYQTIAVFVLFSIVTAVICMVVVALIQKIIRKYAPELKKIWIQSSNNQI